MKMKSLFAKSMITTYIPSGIFAMASFVSFLIDQEEKTGRLSMLVLLFVLQIVTFNGIKAPPSDGTTAIQIYVMSW